MLVLNPNHTILEGDLKLSDCEREFVVKWLSGSSQASLFVGDKPEEQNAVDDFITGEHVCYIRLDSYLKYLGELRGILKKYGSMYYGPFDDFEKIVHSFSHMTAEQARVILSYHHERYIRILNNKKDYKINEPIYGDWALKNGDMFRHSFAGGITSIKITKNNDRYELSVKLLDNWRDIIMQENGKKVTLEAVTKIFNEEIKNRTAEKLTLYEAARIFGIKYEPLLRGNSGKFSAQDVVTSSKYNQNGVLDAVNEGMRLSPSVIWTVNSSEGAAMKENPGATANETAGFNLIVYGTPGCGKSYFVENKLLGTKPFSIGGIQKDGLSISRSMRIRTTFHQDYTNTDFVGQILPKIDGKDVTYSFHPGPFTLALIKALDPKNNGQSVALIIEELNRGSAASIFGDIFQLLDRKPSGESVYSIVNPNISDYINLCFKGDPNWKTIERISIPANLFIVATMNTSDQNVFTLDTAFKRRWKFQKLANEFTADHDYKDYVVPGFDTKHTYEEIIKCINEFIIDKADQFMSEDKQIGVYFLEKGQLIENKMTAPTTEQKREVAFKLLEYLWDDVSRMQHDFLFRGDIKTLDQLLEAFEKDGEKVFAAELVSKLEKAS